MLEVLQSKCSFHRFFFRTFLFVCVCTIFSSSPIKLLTNHSTRCRIRQLCFHCPCFLRPCWLILFQNVDFLRRPRRQDVYHGGAGDSIGTDYPTLTSWCFMITLFLTQLIRRLVQRVLYFSLTILTTRWGRLFNIWSMDGRFHFILFP